MNLSEDQSGDNLTEGVKCFKDFSGTCGQQPAVLFETDHIDEKNDIHHMQQQSRGKIQVREFSVTL